MGHNSRYQRITWELSEPLEGVNNSFTMVGIWRTSALISNTFIDVPTIKQTQEWIDRNAPDKFIITSQSGMFRLSNDQLAETPRISSERAIVELQKLLELSNPPEIIDFEQILETSPDLQIILEGTEQTQEVPIQTNNNLRNALLIGGALLLL